ncbi:MAG: hypothetical protein AB7U05_08355 [Mangrovibacterium sp.]
MSDIFSMFVKYNPNFLEKLNLFPEALKTTLLGKLNKAQTETIFLSFVSEINFGLLFNELGFSLQYERILFEKKTPDWTISIDNNEAICEVYRLGQSEKDQINTNIENELKRKFEEIKCGYKIKYSLQDDLINPKDYDIKNIIFELKTWLSNNRKIGDIITIDNKIKFEIVTYNQNNKLTYTTSKQIDYKIHKLIQTEYLKDDNRVTEKLSKYSSGILQLKLPYFLCIESDFKNGFYFEEFVDYFRGSYCAYTENESFENSEHEIEYSKLGCLYDHNTVSGIIIKIGNDYRIIINPLKRQLIYNKDNLQILRKINMIQNADV